MPRQKGIAYIGLLLLIAVMGITLGAAADVWSTTRQRQREAELLWVGNQYREAILTYFASTPGDNKLYPMTLEDLLLDKRSLVPRRYLRRIYPDPFTSKADWELLMAPQGGIAGIRSRYVGTPLKKTGFRPRDLIFEGKNSYADWQFSAMPPAPPLGVPGSVPPGGATPPGMAGAPTTPPPTPAR